MRPGDRDGLDRWLDRALQQYGGGEPRPGLENRILANLGSEVNGSGTAKVAIGLRWRYAFAAVVFAAGALAAFWSGNHTSLQTLAPAAVANLKSPSRSPGGAVSTPRGNGRFAPPPRVSTVRSPSRARDLPSRSEITQGPRLQQFPSPRPLSDQERLLVACVRNHPDAAIAMARAQAEFNQEQEQEMERLSSEQ